jgi:DNA primase
VRLTSEQIEQINNSISIVEYASKYLELNQGVGKRSNEYWTNCIFHNNDLNASLSFNSDKNLYKCFGCGAAGGLINFVMQYHKKTFPQAIEHILQLVNIDLKEVKPSETMEYLHKVSRKKCVNNSIIHTYLPEDIMNQYTKEPIKEWLQEGISQEALDKYEARYNKPGNAIVFPLRDSEGKVIAVKARTLYQNHRDMGIPKYIYYQSIGSNDFLGGLYYNKQNIINKNEVIVVEGFKGILLAESQGYNNVVSLETNNINKYQIQLLLSLRVPITFALDKGVRIDSKIVGLLPKFTDVYYLEDREGLLQDKDCPFDRGKVVSDRLYGNKIKYER